MDEPTQDMQAARNEEEAEIVESEEAMNGEGEEEFSKLRSYCILWRSNDGKLSQEQWEQFCDAVDAFVSTWAMYSYDIGHSPSSMERRRGFCFFLVLAESTVYDAMCKDLQLLAERFQESLALMVMREGLIISPTSREADS